MTSPTPPPPTLNSAQREENISSFFYKRLDEYNTEKENRQESHFVPRMSDINIKKCMFFSIFAHLDRGQRGPRVYNMITSNLTVHTKSNLPGNYVFNYRQP